MTKLTLELPESAAKKLAALTPEQLAELSALLGYEVKSATISPSEYTRRKRVNDALMSVNTLRDRLMWAMSSNYKWAAANTIMEQAGIPEPERFEALRTLHHLADISYLECKLVGAHLEYRYRRVVDCFALTEPPATDWKAIRRAWTVAIETLAIDLLNEAHIPAIEPDITILADDLAKVHYEPRIDGAYASNRTVRELFLSRLGGVGALSRYLQCIRKGKR